MEQDVNADGAAAHDAPIGARLRAAREKAGYALEQVAAETRIPQRHLVAIEEGAFSRLPSRTYAIGFTRTYARLVGMDEKAAIDDVRQELASDDPMSRASTANFEPGDPARVPGRGLAWFGALAAVLFLAGAFTFYRSYFTPAMGLPPLTDPADQQGEAPAAQATAQAAATPAPAAPVGGPVVFTANMDGTWVKFYDAKGTRLFEAQMAKGDSFTVPADADGPQIWTGRPYALDITVGGKAVPRLGEGDTIIKDVPVSAEALLARADAAPAPGGAAMAPAPAPVAISSAPAARIGGEGGAR